MSNLDKMYESKFMQALQKGGNKFASNKVFNAISGGMMGSMGLIMAGALFTIVATLLNVTGICETTDSLYIWLTTPYNMTMGILSVAVSFMVGYNYAKNLEMKAIVNGIVTMTLFLLIASPIQTVALADGSSMTVLNSSYLGSAGLFVALFMPILATRITYFCEKKNITIKMPDSVPQFLSDSFATVISLTINLVFWHGINTICLATQGVTLPAALMNLIAVPLAGLVSVPGIIFLVFLGQILWTFGIHGTAIMFTVVLVPYIQYYTTNSELVAAGQAPVFATVALIVGMGCCGGTGNILPLSIMFLRSKSKQLRAMGKAGIVPAVFNISEPILFGAPIMYNPIMAIPFILNPIIIMLVMYVGYSIDFFQPSYIMLMTALPLFFAEFLSSMAWQNIFIPILGFLIAGLVYYPFFKVYEHQLCIQEEAEM